MTEKINELKALIETLAEDSPLRKQLQDALDAELKRKAQEKENASQQAAEPQEENTNQEDEKDEDVHNPFHEWKGLEEKLKAMSEKLEEECPSSITGKLEKLMEDEEFITASAGFVLGAAVTGLSVLAISALKK
ncbi:MAG: hypothetical protein IJS08_13225 [Victivallales bacterium]|nr:hypothetical protein [Victivallales bacterium]